LKGNKNKEMKREGYKIQDFEMLKQTADSLGLHLAIDNNRDGVLRLARYNKSFLSRKLNASGQVWVYMLRPDFLPWKEKLVCEYIFEK